MPRLTAGASLPPPSSSQDQDHFAEGKEVRKRKGARAEWNHPEASGSFLIPCTPRPHGRNRLRPYLTEGRSVLKEVEGPSPKTGQLLVLFVVLLVKTFTEREGTLPICAPARPLDADNSCPHLAAPASRSHAAHMHISRGRLGRLLLRQVNVLIKSWSELVSTRSQMCLAACN